LGHYVGTLKARLELQDQAEVFLLIADYHALIGKATGIEKNVRDVLLDYLSVGIDLNKVTIYRQSSIPQTFELATIFSTLITEARLQRVPTLKEAMRASSEAVEEESSIRSPSLGLLGYPVLQAADIALVKGELVPVGKDQASHLEVTREIVHRFNSDFGKVFPEPEALIKGGVLPGTDGKAKMSKSLGNAIMLSDDDKTVKEKVMGMYTDPTRIRPTDPGHIEGNPVFAYLDAFDSNQNKVSELKEHYQKGTVGDVKVKEYLVQVLNGFLEPIRTRRQELSKRTDFDKILEEGKNKVLPIAAETISQARKAIGIE
jgi:tryptophanyl-tRNA synthetase